MDYRHKSGAQKRKEQKDRERKAAVGRRTLESLGFTISSRSHLSEVVQVPPEVESTTSENKESSEVIENNPNTKSVSSNITCGFISSSDSQSSEAQKPTAEIEKNTLVSNENLEEIENPNDIPSNSNSLQFSSNAPSLKSRFAGTKNEIVLNNNKKLLNFDIGILGSKFTITEIEDAIRRGPEQYPKILPQDKYGNNFPTYILNVRLKNNEIIPRNWLVWSKVKQALFCFPCRLFCKLPEAHRSVLTVESGWAPSKGYQKLYNRIPEHENSNNHRACYIEWRNLECSLNTNTTVDCLLQHQIQSETQLWKDLLRRFLDVILFLAERGLAFRGSSLLVGDPRNGNFLGMLEIISHYDPLLAEHLRKVKQSQCEKKRLAVHYLSPEIQNEFISCCAELVFSKILKEREMAKYFSIMVDATPDSAHVEQTTFILRYVLFNNDTGEYAILERFMEFVNCNQKSGEAIANLILQTLEQRKIPINDCRGQGYDNGSNMSGSYKGAQNRILEVNPLAIFSPCACHSLNLCGVHAAECCPEVTTFFGIVQKLYNIFSSSPQRWEILKENIGSSIHSLSNTRWSARVEGVKPIAQNLPGIKKAIAAVLQMNLSPEARMDLNGIKTYMESFQCVLMASVWMKILTTINYVSTILQARKATIDVEVQNLSTLLNDLQTIRNSWETILTECQLVAQNLGMQTEFAVTRQKKPKRRADESELPNESLNLSSEESFRYNVFNVLLDTITANMTRRFEAAKAINGLFSVLWEFQELEEQDIVEKTKKLQNRYQKDISEDITSEILHLRVIYKSNFKEHFISPLEFLNKIKQLRLETIFPNTVIALRIFCTIPVTVAQAERSFSCLSRIKNVLRSTMTQNRLSDLGLLSIESELAKTCDFSEIIDLFANRKARKAPLVKI